MKQTIYSHIYDNGLVLLAEAMESVESAAFSFRVPAGCVYDPAKLGGLGTMTCELAMRGCGNRDNRRSSSMISTTWASSAGANPFPTRTPVSAARH